MNEKIENLLNVSMNVSDEIRKSDPNLLAGYDKEERTWEFVIRYTGSQEQLAKSFGKPFVFLLNQYAVSRGTKEEIERLASSFEVIVIEKPKAMEYAVLEGKDASCIAERDSSQNKLDGEGVLISIIDSGVDVFHPDFRKEDGTTRILGYWDQTGEGKAPAGYLGGAYFEKEEIDEIIKNGRTEKDSIVFGDPSGHGTHVAGIAAGNGRASNGRYQGVAPKANLFVVKLGTPGDSDFPRTTQVMTGIDLSIRFALKRNLPLVINLSFGNQYGPHDGTGLLETYLNEAAGLGRISIVTGTGNEGNKRIHVSGRLTEEETVEFTIGPKERYFGVQIWKNYADRVSYFITMPDGKEAGPFSGGEMLSKVQFDDTVLFFFYGEPLPYRISQEVCFLLSSVKGELIPGTYAVRMIPERIKEGNYQMWMMSDRILSPATGFLRPNPNNTITIPGTAGKVISVGAYDPVTDRMAPFSGRGEEGEGKPDLAAPGINIKSCAPGGGYTIKSGTSMAVPFVTGSAALMMQWGILKGKDPFLYGEKVKAYLRRGARPLPGYDIYPNNISGYGALCLEDSFPEEQ